MKRPGKKLAPKGLPQKQRRTNVREQRPRFLIVCEGSQTEPNYFRQFRVYTKVVTIIIGLGENTLSLVRKTCDRMKESDYTEVWCVFDRDSFPASNFNAALALARVNNIQVAHSSEAFELWFLLHFYYVDSALSRTQYAEKLSKSLGKAYRKNDVTIFETLLDRQITAIQNAQKLLDSYGVNHNPERDNPCTTVHKLVLKLMKFSR